ncbi:MAG: precorrin-6A reductase [Firmicutes bacterium]|nr:precorrin-6A reductase [Bacillota bacterium]
MCKLCVFAGTTEGRELVEFLRSQPTSVTACVATEYGETLLKPGDNLMISAKRMTREDMAALFRKERFDLVVDATHPYASAVTQNICQACAETGTEYLRLLRSDDDKAADAVFVPDIPAAVAYLNQVTGNILLTTGSKELAKFSSVTDFAGRVFARVLPMEDSLRLCREAGLPPSHILAMQGPFSREMNAAMLRSVAAAYLVTKQSGSAGGFEEKISAAREVGATAVVIGRPPQIAGLDFSGVVSCLCSRFGFTWKPEISIVGIGPGSRAFLTSAAEEAIRHADCVIGAKRMLESAALPGQPVVEAIAPEAIAEYIHSHREYRRFAVVMSGDVGFFSGTKKLLPMLSDCKVRTLPGISSLVYLCAKLGTSYENVVCVSAHGRQRNLCADVSRHRRVFVLTGGENGMGILCQKLVKGGLGHVTVSVGQNLGYPEEKIVTGTAESLSSNRFPSLCAALIENPSAKVTVTQGLPDDTFLRAESVPMTKSEVRCLCLSKLRLTADAVVWDVGAGSGSVTMEMALAASEGQIYAIERRETALALLEKNRDKFQAENVTIVPGTAPEACRELPAPTHAFIGGAGGNLRGIIGLLLEKNPNVRIVATAIALESVGELTRCLQQFPFRETDVVCLTVAKARKAGAYSLMTGQNPIYLFTMQGGMGECGR